MKALPILLLLAACGNPDGEPIQVEPIEITVTVTGDKPIVIEGGKPITLSLPIKTTPPSK
jgi:hypothetical protein